MARLWGVAIELRLVRQLSWQIIPVKLSLNDQVELFWSPTELAATALMYVFPANH